MEEKKLTEEPDKTVNHNKKRTRAFVDLLLEMYMDGEMTMEHVQEHVDNFMFGGKLSLNIWAIFN